ncbi:MAG: hypothetical protein LW826_01400, partial [Candidatus Jidaibacter sp.]|nr:hypothetical protein [Candidatus Jidaibacter sp.]
TNKDIILTNATMDLETFATIIPLINQGVQVLSIGFTVEIPHFRMNDFIALVEKISDADVKERLSACMSKTHTASVADSKVQDSVISH